MKEKKQELLKLIENLDWDKFTSISGYGCCVYAYILSILMENQKEKTIEQELEDLGFIRKDAGENYGLYYQGMQRGEILLIEYVCSDNQWSMPDILVNRYRLVIKSHKTKEILNFANYLVNLKNGVTE